jgi:hypothetical protein
MPSILPGSANVRPEAAALLPRAFALLPRGAHPEPAERAGTARPPPPHLPHGYRRPGTRRTARWRATRNVSPPSPSCARDFKPYPFERQMEGPLSGPA